MCKNTELMKKIVSMTVIFIICIGNCFHLTQVWAISSEEIVEDVILDEIFPYLVDVINPTEAQIDEAMEQDSINIQQAINQETNGKRLIVKLRAGKYYIKSGIRIENNNIKIEGENGTIFMLGDNGNEDSVDNVFFISGTKQDRNNIIITGIDIEGNENSKEKWHGITILRTKVKYEVSNISVLNCSIRNINGRGVNIGGFKKEIDDALETKYADNREVGEAIRDLARINRTDTVSQQSKYDEYIENGILTGFEDICQREWFIRYTVNNVSIEGCTINNTAGGIIQNTTNGTKIINNNISNSYNVNRATKGAENITIDFADNCTCMGNTLSGTYGGCANIGTGESDNCIIRGNIIDNSSYNREDPKFNVGISHQSISGISHNYIVADNHIINANCGVWLKDNRYKVSNTYAGARSGDGFYVINNTIDNYMECAIKVAAVTGNFYVTGNICKSEFTKNDIEMPDNDVFPNTKLSEFVENIKSGATIKIFKDTKEITDENALISTGMKVQIYMNGEMFECNIVVKGDTNGDGQADIKDLFNINKHRLNKVLLKGEYLLAGDVNKDQVVDIKDLFQLNKFRLGKINNL